MKSGFINEKEFIKEVKADENDLGLIHVTHYRKNNKVEVGSI